MLRGSRFIILRSCALALAVTGICYTVAAQTRTFTSAEGDFTLELPSPTWRAIAQPDSVHQHTEFINGERNEGYLRIRKEVVDAGTTPSDLARRDQDQKLRYLPGYVEGKEEQRFEGHLNGITTSYEYSNGGKLMAGLIYYLQADNRTIYTLQFTGARDKLELIRNQTDYIARSFHVK